ncbi:hypothetical protein LCGC14_0337940 [marine sediment metagenome]|uniref:Uncharacterized protein n=1 Tax=marine sediment metagenome TaxID=412755 RepID=A0A0F9TEE5_9ZZZZ
MQWTFLNLYDRILARLHSSSSNTVLLAEVKNWINVAYQDLHSRPNKVAPWAVRRSTVLTTAPTTSSTIELTFTVDDATVSAASAVFTSGLVGQKIKLDAFSEVYTIRTFTSATAIEMDQIFNGTTTTSSGWRIWDDTVLMPPMTHEILSLQIRGQVQPLGKLDPQEFMDQYGDNHSPGTPVDYSEYPPDAQEGAVTALTGTVTFNDEDTAVTGSGTAFLTEAKVGDLVRKASTDTLWREVSSIASDTALTLRQAWNGTTGAGASGGSQKADGWQRFQLGPHADDEYSLIVRAQHIPVEMAADANIPEMPENIVPILIDGALAIGHEYRDDPRKEEQRNKYEQEVAKVLSDVRKTSQRPRLTPNLEAVCNAFPGR